MAVATAPARGRTSTSNHFEIFAGADGRAHIRGSLTFATARQARDDGLRKFRECGSKASEVDCSEITDSDSGGLTVLLDWLALAKRDGRSLRFVKLPKGLISLAKISEVDELLQTGV